eukprot:1437809-Pyramimonas_sp.AAC.1
MAMVTSAPFGSGCNTRNASAQEHLVEPSPGPRAPGGMSPSRTNNTAPASAAFFVLISDWVSSSSRQELATCTVGCTHKERSERCHLPLLLLLSSWATHVGPDTDITPS